MFLKCLFALPGNKRAFFLPLSTKIKVPNSSLTGFSFSKFISGCVKPIKYSHLPKNKSPSHFSIFDKQTLHTSKNLSKTSINNDNKSKSGIDFTSGTGNEKSKHIASEKGGNISFKDQRHIYSITRRIKNDSLSEFISWRKKWDEILEKEYKADIQLCESISESERDPDYTTVTSIIHFNTDALAEKWANSKEKQQIRKESKRFGSEVTFSSAKFDDYGFTLGGFDPHPSPASVAEFGKEVVGPPSKHLVWFTIMTGVYPLAGTSAIFVMPYLLHLELIPKGTPFPIIFYGTLGTSMLFNIYLFMPLIQEYVGNRFLFSEKRKGVLAVKCLCLFILHVCFISSFVEGQRYFTENFLSQKIKKN